MTSPDNDVVEFRAPELLSVKQAVERLHGSAYTETDLNRFYRQIKCGNIEFTLIGQRKFIPSWQVDKLAQRAR